MTLSLVLQKPLPTTYTARSGCMRNCLGANIFKTTHAKLFFFRVKTCKFDGRELQGTRRHIPIDPLSSFAEFGGLVEIRPTQPSGDTILVNS